MQFETTLKSQPVILLLLAMHIVGVVGMNIPMTSELFLSMSPINLLASAAIVFAYHQDWSPKFIRTLIIFGLAGFAVEVLGTNFGLPFGQYIYGNALGLSILGVPLVMGVTWALLLYSTAIIAYQLVEEKWARIVLASFLMVFIDIWIEPIAGKLDYWHWEEGHAPLINFLGWGIVSMLLHALFFIQGLGEKNKMAIVYYPIVCIFFILLNFFL